MAFGHNDVCLLGLLGKINKKDGIFAYSYSFCVNFGKVKADKANENLYSDVLHILLSSVESFVFEHELPRMTMNFQKLKTMLLASNHTRYGGEEYEETYKYWGHTYITLKPASEATYKP